MIQGAMRTACGKVGLFMIVPLILYFAIFCVYTYPWISRFSTHYFCDMGDGIQLFKLGKTPCSVRFSDSK